MHEPSYQICFDRLVPAARRQLAWERGVVENPQNASPEEAAVLRAYLWQPGRTLRVAFLKGTQKLHDKVVQYAAQWTAYANLHFTFGSTDADAEIRITANPALGNWSEVGTNALAVAPGQATMNLGELAHDPSEDRYVTVILHEFGHALGLIHEHQSPASGIQWNREAVIADLSGPPNYWSDEQIEYNVFLRYSKTQTQFKELLPDSTEMFDPTSIMVYPIPPHWTLDGYAVAPNAALSTLDQQFISRCYPKT